ATRSTTISSSGTRNARSNTLIVPRPPPRDLVPVVMFPNERASPLDSGLSQNSVFKPSVEFHGQTSRILGRYTADTRGGDGLIDLNAARNDDRCTGGKG